MTDAVDTAAHAMGFMLADMLNSDGPIDMDALARAALTAVLDAVTLEWSGPLSSGRFAAWSPLGTFTIYRTHSGFSWQEPLVGNGGYVDTLAAAQAAALADYRARLARALGMEEG